MLHVLAPFFLGVGASRLAAIAFTLVSRVGSGASPGLRDGD
jgi:hypothetical protein